MLTFYTFWIGYDMQQLFLYGCTGTGKKKPSTTLDTNQLLYGQLTSHFSGSKQTELHRFEAKQLHDMYS